MERRSKKYKYMLPEHLSPPPAFYKRKHFPITTGEMDDVAEAVLLPLVGTLAVLAIVSNIYEQLFYF